MNGFRKKREVIILLIGLHPCFLLPSVHKVFFSLLLERRSEGTQPSVLPQKQAKPSLQPLASLELQPPAYWSDKHFNCVNTLQLQSSSSKEILQEAQTAQRSFYDIKPTLNDSKISLNKTRGGHQGKFQ